MIAGSFFGFSVDTIFVCNCNNFYFVRPFISELEQKRKCECVLLCLILKIIQLERTRDLNMVCMCTVTYMVEVQTYN